VTVAEGAVERPPEFPRREAPQEPGAVVTQAAFANVRWEQPLVVVNLHRAVLYAPGLVKS
jgi:hypothetical protein